MAVTPLAATRAYSSIARLAGLGGASSAEAVRPSFGDMVGSGLRSLVDAGRKADSASQNFLVGKADVVDVVTAVADVEVAFDSLVAIRDRVISAYEEIMRMPI